MKKSRTLPKFNCIKDELDYYKSELEKTDDLLRRETYNRQKVEGTLREETRMNAHIDETEIINWHVLTICDKKMLAMFHWDELSDKQKSEFGDKEIRQMFDDMDKIVEDRMSDPNKMRQYFLNGAAPILNDMIDIATGKSTNKTDAYAFKEVWEVLRGIIQSTNNKAPMLDLRNKDVTQQIDEILTNVTSGAITFDEAKEYMSLVSSGFNLQELPKLMAKLEMIESQ